MQTTSYSIDRLTHTTGKYEVHYRNGKEVYAMGLGYDGKKWSDTAFVYTTYDVNGKKIRKESRSIASRWADSSSYIVEEVHRSRGDQEFDYSYASQILLDSLMRKPRFNYNVITIIDTIFSDTLEVATASTFSLGSCLDKSIDSMFYFPGHRLKTVVRYANNSSIMRLDYAYVFNEKDQLTEFKRTSRTFGSTQNISTSEYLYDAAGKQFLYRTASFELNPGSADTLHLASGEITYDEQFRTVSVRGINEGQLFNYSTVQYDPDNSIVTITYNKDSVIRSKSRQYSWERSTPGKKESWLAIDYMDGGDIVASYTCVDTVMSRGKMKVAGYSGIYTGKLFEQAPLPKRKCRINYSMSYDTKKRLVEVKSYGSKGLSYQANYRYSR